MDIIEWTLVIAFFGLLIGSFLNVLIARLPCEESFVSTRSHCPHCQQTLQWYDLVPLLSYIRLKAKCRYCQHPISVQYPCIELLTAILFGWSAYHYGLSPQALYVSVWGSFLITLSAIDIKTYLLPDSLTYPFLWLALLMSTTSFGWISPTSALWGAFFGYMSLWTLYWIFKACTGKEGLGFGDFKLLAGLGATFGWQALPTILLVAASIGSLVGITLIALQKQSKEHPIPFGPFLALGGFVMLLK